jgi:hypothetical protein
MMGLGIFLFAAALSCAPVDALPVPIAANAPFTVHDLDILPIPAGAEESCMAIHGHDTMPLPRMMDQDFHAQMHQSASSRNGAKRQDVPCGEWAQYYEKDYFSSAAHTTMVGWRFRWCDGSYHWNGSVTAYCDSYVQCCDPPYEDEISTCEGS